MPIARPPETDALRLGGELIGTAAPLSADLLPTDGTQPPAPVSAPTRALALDALRLLGRSDGLDRRPWIWSDPRFADEVAIVLRQLAPLRTRRALAASFAREAFRLAPEVIPRDGASPVRVAYALRWRELGTR